MSSAKITLFSFAQWMQLNDEDLFSEMILPEGVDKEVLTDNILLRGGEFEVLYSEPNFMQRAIGSWSKKWYRTFTKWVEALALEYNPLENYDRMEDYTDTTNRGLTSSGRKDSGNTRTFDNEDKETRDYENKETRDISDERTYNNTDERTLDTSNVLDGTVEEKVSAYDSSSYQPSRNTDTDNTTTDTGTITDAHTGTVTDAGTGTDTFNYTGTDTFNHTGTITDEYGEGVSGSEKENTTAKHTGRLHGNIGVTTSQQMLEAELDIAKWNLYEHITDVFLEEFIIPIYS